MVRKIDQKTELFSRQWHLIDANGLVLGRLASRISIWLRGKHRPNFLPYRDLADWGVVINCEKIKLTGNKLDKKIYRRYTGYPGGLKTFTLREKMAKDATSILREAVRTMLPDNKLRKPALKRLKVFKGLNHDYTDKKFIIHNSL